MTDTVAEPTTAEVLEMAANKAAFVPDSIKQDALAAFALGYLLTGGCVTRASEFACDVVEADGRDALGAGYTPEFAQHVRTSVLAVIADDLAQFIAENGGDPTSV